MAKPIPIPVLVDKYADALTICLQKILPLQKDFAKQSLTACKRTTPKERNKISPTYLR
ncbi:MAG: hypothetical protein FWD52_03270 [Candidatus Bathyarchaeota archaeon]|nr:hypothetical protein [Candidatus Termiticorpusculum sp.]